MKTLHVETGRHLYGGPQQVLYLAAGLEARGHETILVCPPDTELGRAARDADVDVVTLECRGDLDLPFVWRLRQVIADRGPDLVHCHSRRGGDFLGGQAAVMAGVPAVVSRRVDNREPGILSALRYRNFVRVIAISRAVESVLLDAGLARHRLKVIRDAVDLSRFRSVPSREELHAEFGLDPQKTWIVSAAQFIERKGQRFLLEALARLRDRHSGIAVVLFGKGPDESALRRLASDLGLDESVVFAGFRDDLDDWLGGFDLLVHTALAEGLGVIVLKAQAAGLPVVAFAAGGVPEAVVHEQTGLLVPAADARRLAAAIGTLLDDSARRGSYSEAARVHVAEHFSTETMIDEHLSLYRSVLDGAG